MIGDYPRIHNVKLLLGELNRILKSHELEEFMAIKRANLLALEDAYFMFRYFVREYEKEDAEDMVELVEELLSIIKKALGVD